MKQNDWRGVIAAKRPLAAAFESIAGGVNQWWAKNFEGSSQKLGDVFTVRFGETFVTFKVTEFVPGRKIEWSVTDCFLHWINDKTEWKGTRVLFEFEPKGDQTQITMTHIGLTPERECYADCDAGWSQHFKASLYKLLSEGAGQPM